LLSGAALKVARPKALLNRIRQDDPIWVGRNLVTGLGHFVAQPTLYSSVALLKRTQTGPDHFTGGAIGAGFHEAIDEGRMLLRQTDSPFLNG